MSKRPKKGSEWTLKSKQCIKVKGHTFYKGMSLYKKELVNFKSKVSK